MLGHFFAQNGHEVSQEVGGTPGWVFGGCLGCFLMV